MRKNEKKNNHSPKTKKTNFKVLEFYKKMFEVIVSDKFKSYLTIIKSAFLV